MRLPCPHCGSRDIREFTPGGDGSLTRPDPETASPEDWCAYVYARSNPRGRHVELWHHTQGCRLWLRVERDTQSHEVFSAEIVGPYAALAKPGMKEAAE